MPVIECPDAVKADEMFQVKVSLGKEVVHPNTADHHIRWIQLFFKPDGDKFTYQIGNFEFAVTDNGQGFDGARVISRVVPRLMGVSGMKE